MSEEWTPELVADTKNALAIIRSTVIEGDAVVYLQQRLDKYLTNLDSAARTASGAVKVTGLLLEYIRQLQQQHQDLIRTVLDHYDPERNNHPEDVLAPKTPTQVLDFLSSRLPKQD
jgi:hypothetical protein